MVNQRVDNVARENVESGFLDYLLPMMRDEITDGRYILDGNVLRERNVRVGCDTICYYVSKSIKRC